MAEKIVRIGGASAFWGDSAIAAPQLVQFGNIDYMIADYLAEITMSIMARARAADPNMGYAVDFVTVTMKRLIKDIARKKIKVVTNAGGVNPQACAEAVRKVAAEAGVELKVAAVVGDDLLERAAAFRELGVKEMYSGAEMPAKLMSMNAYLGAVPIAKALAEGADIVITGRAVDSAITLGPLMYEFDWRVDDLDKMAAGSLAGHIIECGAQACGGLFTDWDQVPAWENIGYPVIECASDGSFIVGKPPGTGGIVTRGTVSEQLVYEIGDPQAYMLPDVVCDFTAVKIEEVGENRVKVSGARGYAPTSTYKVSATYQDGWRAIVQLTIGGIDAIGKAKKTADAILARTRRMFQMLNMGDYRETRVEVLGAESMYGPHSRITAAREVVLRIAVKHDERVPLELFCREIAQAGTSMSPGTTGSGGGRSKPQPIVRLFSCLVPKDKVPITVDIGARRVTVEVPTKGGFDRAKLPKVEAKPAAMPAGATVTVPLVKLAWGRSGDKGNDSNIGIIARKPEYLPVIRAQLTAEAVRRHMAYAVEGEVERFDLPGPGAVNFLLHEALGGGGVNSLRNDPQGKAFAQMLLDFPVQVPASWGLAA
ncbi:MAG TPA: acyclic terpene utilization AtuA family protein [Candidatus Cybelea sp.]|nr:acyclic terpene utilization AtuA family protein [Candidatus Cybelea sp.]